MNHYFVVNYCLPALIFKKPKHLALPICRGGLLSSRIHLPTKKRHPKVSQNIHLINLMLLLTMQASIHKHIRICFWFRRQALLILVFRGKDASSHDGLLQLQPTIQTSIHKHIRNRIFLIQFRRLHCHCCIFFCKYYQLHYHYLVYPLIKTPLYINLSQAHSYHIPIYRMCDKKCRKIS